jgi:putative zinc finger protein
MMADCFEIQNHLTDYMDDRLSEAALQAVRAHLNGCESCSLLLLEMQYTLRLCKDYPELEPPPALLEKILAQTTGQYKFLSWKDYLRELVHPLFASPRFATGALLAAISLSVVFNGLGVNLTSMSLSDLTPRNLVEKVDRVINIAYDNGLRRLNDLKILYQIQSRLEELKIQGEEKNVVPLEKDKKKEGSGILENGSVLPILVGNVDHAGSVNLS